MNQLRLAEKKNLIYGALLAVLIVLPLIFQSAQIHHICILLGLYIMLALGLEIALGLTGLFALCHAAFYGMGAYASALLSIYGFSFWITLPAAVIISGLFGMLIGFPSLRMKGDYLAIATLGFGEIFRLMLVNGGEITRGPRGLTDIARPELFFLDFSNKITYYYMVLFFCIATYFFVLKIPRTFFGRALMAIRDDEDAAEFMGINTAKYKITAFVISGLLAGLAGGLYAHYIRYISPDTFIYNDSINILTMVLIGGSGTVIGPVIGAIVLTVLPELLRSLVEYRMLIYGLLVVIMMQIRPEGLLGKVNLRTKSLTKIVEKGHWTSKAPKEKQ